MAKIAKIAKMTIVTVYTGEPDEFLDATRDGRGLFAGRGVRDSGCCVLSPGNAIRRLLRITHCSRALGTWQALVGFRSNQAKPRRAGFLSRTNRTPPPERDGEGDCAGGI